MSWRESSDPRCPECGGKIAATASYCMHCEADLDGDSNTSEDSILADDEYGTVDSGDQSEMPSKSWDKPDDVTDSTAGDESDAGSSIEETIDRLSGDSGRGDRHKIESLAHSLTSFLWTDVPEPEGVPDSEFTAPLWMRVPVGLVAGLVVFIAFLVYATFLLSPLPGSGILVFFSFFLIMAWLIRKPLPSDILGDAAYALAAMLYSVPIVFIIVNATRSAVGLTDMAISEVLVTGLIISFGTWIPATILLAVGYAGNRYARSKLDTIAEESDGKSATQSN
jgi:uncharacterized RDD family membrane protein YckC